jgi:DNA-binding SARP family transcriptional activator
MPRQARVEGAGAPVAIVFLRERRAALAQPLPQPLRIYTLGRFGLVSGAGGLAVEKWKRKQAVTLLKCLVAHLGRAVHREYLIECLWPETDEARGWERLKVTVYFLRRQLRAAGIEKDVVETVGRAYLMRRDAVWVDADAFERLVAEGAALARQERPEDALGCYEDAHRLYRGDYLEDDPYADWCAAARERLREIHLEMLAGMAECCAECGRWAMAAQVCRTALVHDPSRESFLRSLLEYLVRLGRVDWVEAEYRRWQRILAQDLDLELMPETQRLYQQIVRGEAVDASCKVVGGKPE